MSITDFFNFLHGFYTSLPWIFQEVIYIVVIVSLFRRYVGKDIETEIDKRGWLKDGLVHAIVRHLRFIAQRHRDIYREERLKLGV